MNNLTTRKIVLGLLMALVLAFSVQGIADALTLTATSDTTQTKEPNDAPFEIQFSVRMNSNAIAYNDASPRRRVTDANTGAVRIDSSGYMVTTVNGTERRTLDGNPTLTPTGNGASPVLGSPHPSYRTDASDPPVAVPQAPDSTQPYFVDTSGNVFDNNGAAVYIRRGTGARNPDSPYTYTRANSNPNREGNPVPLANRFDYNEEAILIAVAKLSGSTFGALSAGDMDISIKGGNYFISPQHVLPSAPTLTEMSGLLKSSMTLVCDTMTAGTYKITIMDATDERDFPRNIAEDLLTVAETASANPPSGIRRSTREFTLHVTTETVATGNKIEAKTLTGGTTLYLRVDTGKAIEHISDDFVVTPEAGNLEIRYRVASGSGTLYAAETSTTGIYRGPNQDLTVHQSANVFLNTNGTTNEIAASIAGSDRQTFSATIVYEYSGSATATTTTTTTTATNTITISPSSTTGEPGEEVTIRVTSSPNGVFATLGSNDFGATRFSPQSDVTPFTSTLLLPVEEGTHSFFATGGVLTAGRASVTVEAELGTLSITAIGTPDAGLQTFSISAVDADGDRASAPFTARLSGTGFTTRTVEIAGGSGNARLMLPTAASLYTLTASAEGYTSGTTQVRIAGTGQQQVADEDEEEVEEEVTVAAEPDSIEITGPSTRSGTVNEALDTPLLVRVLDDDGDGLEGARVFYRVSSGRGRLSARGNGRAIGVVTDDDGYARASFTPLDGGTITVRANTDDLSATVTFTITTGSASSASGARDSGTGGTPGMISPVVHVGAASRPPMLWVDGGAIYALVGASPQRFAASVDNALNIAIGGGKVYWTEKTGESGGTINSANLNGSDVTELTSIKAVPMGIAVDVAGSQLYWTNSRGRIQSADLDGSGITNVMQNLQSPMDLALAGGNAYWTQGNGSVRFVNLRGQKVVRNVSTGTDTPGSLVIGGGKVYWTEMTGESGGTVNSANLNGTGATLLASILAAPMGIAVDGSRSKLYWSNSRGRIQSANLDGSGITNVVSGLGSPSDMVLSNSIAAPAATTTTTTTTTASRSKYDLNSDGTVDNTDAGLVADAMGTSNARYDVNGDGTVNFLDLLLVFDNRDAGAAGAPTIVGMKMSAAQIDIIKEQIDLLIATNDRSPAAMRTLIYLQQLLVTARPEKTQLLANYPNPFNPETWIPYELATDTDVRITIYNTQGVVIRSLQFGHQSAGYYVGRDRAAYWDGRNALGEQVASGLYFYQLETDEMSLMRKMVILK